VCRQSAVAVAKSAQAMSSRGSGGFIWAPPARRDPSSETKPRNSLVEHAWATVSHEASIGFF
jgi:hypothetical protein